MIKHFAVVATALTLTACGETPVEPTATDVHPSFAVDGAGEWEEVNFILGSQCTAEPVAFHTMRQVRLRIEPDGNGGVHINYARTWVGTGVGLDTGNEYILNWPSEVTEFIAEPPHVMTRRISNNLPSKGSAVNQLFSLTQHLTVNANGEVTVLFSNLTLECVG